VNPLVGLCWGSLSPESRASLPVGTRLDNDRTKREDGWDCPCCQSVAGDLDLALCRIVTFIPEPALGLQDGGQDPVGTTYPWPPGRKAALVEAERTADKERAAIVRWLNGLATEGFIMLRINEACMAEKWALAIERGEHRREEEKS